MSGIEIIFRLNGIMMAKRIPGIPQHFQEFGLCIMFHMLLPLVPLGVEWYLASKISDRSLTLATAMYATAIAISSRSKLFFGCGVFITIMHSIAFGWVQNSSNVLSSNLRSASVWCIIFVFLFHAFERYNRHIVDLVPFWDFGKNATGGTP